MKHLGLIIGDIITLAIVLLVGFFSHGELGTSFAPRMAAAFIPLCAGWFLLAPSLGLFDGATARRVSEAWRPAFVMLFAGPFAALLRSILLGSSVIPSFAIVLTLTSAFALTLWRLLYAFVGRARRPAAP